MDLLNLGSTSSLQGFIWRSADKVLLLILLWNMSTASKTNKNKYLFMIHGVCLILKEKTFLFMSRMFQCHSFAGRLFYFQVDEPS